MFPTNQSNLLKERQWISQHRNIAQLMQLTVLHKELCFIKRIKVCSMLRVWNPRNLRWKIRVFRMQYLFHPRISCINLKCIAFPIKNQQSKRKMKEFKTSNIFCRIKVWWQSMKQVQKAIKKVFQWAPIQLRSLRRVIKIIVSKRLKAKKTNRFNSKTKFNTMSTIRKFRPPINKMWYLKRKISKNRRKKIRQGWRNNKKINLFSQNMKYNHIRKN